MEASQPDTTTQVKVSVIIPCYNQGKWLWEAIDSVLMQDFEGLEIIVINDGSTDPVTNRIVSEIKHPKIQVLHTPNQGLAEARNEGLRRARGEYILPVDSDDRIHPTYVRKACEILDQHRDIGIVYCRAELFGEQQGVWALEPYSFPEILLSPQIFASSMFRKVDWERAGGYKPDMIYGWEDYDFWLSLIGLGVGVHQIDEVLCYYRKTEGSMAGLERKHMLYSFRKLFAHHRELYEANISCLFESVIASKPIRDREKLTRSDVFEVFIPDTGGYAGRNIREQNYPEGMWSRVSVLLNRVPESGIHHLRLDPCQKPAVVDIVSIKLLHASSGKTLFEVSKENGFSDVTLGRDTHNIPHDRFLRLFCATDDSHFFLPSISREVLDQPLVLEVWLFQHTGLECIGAYCEQKTAVFRADKEFATLKETLAEYQSQSEELKQELARQRQHAVELEKLKDALQLRNEAAKSETEQCKLLVENLRSELRQAQQKVEQAVLEASDAKAALQTQVAAQKKSKGWFS